MEDSQVIALVGETEFALQTFELHVADDEIGLAGSSVSNDGALHAGDDGLDVRLIDAKNRGAIKRDAIHKLNECVLDVFERGVLIEMLAVDSGYHGDHGSEH